MKWLLLSFLLACTSGASMATNESFLDRVKVDSLKKALVRSHTDTIRVNLYTELSWNYMYAYPDTALSYALSGVALAQQLNYKKGEVRCMNMVGEALNMKGNYTKSLQINLQALQKAEKLNDPFLLNQCYNFLVNDYLATKDYKKALFYSNKIKANTHRPKWWIVGIHAVQGLCYFHLNQLDSAYYYTKQAYELNLKESFPRANIYETMGLIYEKKREYNKALHFYKLVSKIYNHSNIGIASVFNKMGRQDSAIYYAEKVIENAPVYSIVIEASRLLSDIYKAKGDTINAFKYQEIMLTAKDSLLSQEKVKYIQNLTFNEEQRQQEILAQQQAYQNKLTWYALLGIAALALGVAFIKFKSNLREFGYRA